MNLSETTYQRIYRLCRGNGDVKSGVVYWFVLAGETIVSILSTAGLILFPEIFSSRSPATISAHPNEDESAI